MTATTIHEVRRSDDRTARRLPPLRPYQREVAQAVLERVVRGEGGSLSVEIARQGGKNELSAQLELAALLLHAGRGGQAIKCAPTLEPQARISQARLERRVRDAGLEAAFERRGASLRCGGASLHFLSAEPAANVVGHTASLLLEVDEAQDVDIEKFDRDFRPMAASTDAPVVFYGTPWGPRSLLEQAKAEHRTAERRDGRRRHFRFDWQTVAAHVPAYRRYVEGERARLGERHPLFRTQYALEVVDEAGRLLDAPALAQVEGSHDRQRVPAGGARYVAGLDLAGPARPGSGELDSTVLTIARVTPGEHAPLIEVVELQAWQGEPAESLLASLADRLRRVWHVRHLAVDATGLGGPLADLLTRRLPAGVVEPVVFSVERKSRLGFGLLAAVHSGRLRLFRADGSPEAAECRRQLALARGTYRDERTLRFDVDPAEGHDDYLVSLALAVAAARHVGRPRTARGRTSRAATGETSETAEVEERAQR